MVLDAAAFDDSPQSDFDPYSSNADNGSPSTPSDAPGTLKIDLSQASRPFPILGPLTGFTNQRMIKVATGVAHAAPNIIGRNITQDELDAVTGSVSKYLQIHSWIYCNALILAGFRSANTKKDMRFPGQTFFEGRGINFTVNWNQLGPLKGAMARAGWNAIRTTTWLAWWGLPAYIIGGVAGQIAMAQKQLADPRLKQFREDMRSDGARQRVNKAIERQSQGLPQRPMSQPERTDTDDMSPQSFSQMESPTTLDQSEQVRTETQDQYMRSSSNEPSPRSPTGAKQMGDGGSRYTSQPASSDFAGVDPSGSRSATSGSAWDRVRNQGGQRESAWDRVRRQGASADNQSSTNSWQSRAGGVGGSNVPLSDSFTFDQSDEDKQLAKAEAQREFDARVERERQGKDFSDTKSGRMW